MSAIWKLLPWLLLGTVVLSLYLTNHWPFGKKEVANQDRILKESILIKVEKIGKLELIKHHFKEVLEFQRLSSGKIKTSTSLGTYDFDPDLSLLMVATGEAVGCIDLATMTDKDIRINGDTIDVFIPAAELCYHKLNNEETRIIEFDRKGWYSRLFPDDQSEKAFFQQAYREAEGHIKEAALQSNILDQTESAAKEMLTEMFSFISEKKVRVFIRHNEILRNEDFNQVD